MPTTTNYGWTTPADTDLVKDGASAIRTLGTAIDTTVFNNASAAIAKTIVDAKGDIIAATASDTVARLAVGSNDQVLTADSSTATGLKWATVAAGGMTLLSSGSIGSSGIDLTSISGSYEQLRLKLIDLDVNGAASLYYRFNNDSTSSYQTLKLVVSNGAFNSDPSGLIAQFQTNYEPFATGQTGAVSIMDLKNYSDTTGWKTIESLTCYIDNNGSRNVASNTYGFWKNENAINRITVTLSTSSFSAGTYELWGMK